jgi:hypothetical protein
MKKWITSDLHFGHFIELCINTTKGTTKWQNINAYA